MNPFLVPGLLLGGSLLAVFVATTAAAATSSGERKNTEGEVAQWEVIPEEGLWAVRLTLPDTQTDYLYNTETGEPMRFRTSQEARDFAVGYLKGLGFE